jgi:hypothetical protein
MDAYMTQIIVDMLDYIEDCRQIVLAPDFDHIDMEEAMQVICLYLGCVCLSFKKMIFLKKIRDFFVKILKKI